MRHLTFDLNIQPPPLPAKTGNRPMRTSQLYTSDNNNSFSSVWHQKFETLKSIFHKKAPTNRLVVERSLLECPDHLSSCSSNERSMLGGSTASANRSATNTKHALVLQEAGIAYDTPLNPVQVAAVRAERIAQKQKAAAAMAEQAQVQQQQQRLANLAAASPAVSGTTVAPSSPVTTARVTSAASPSTLSANPMASATVSTTQIGSSVVMNTISSASSSNAQHTLLLQGSSTASLQGSAVRLLITIMRELDVIVIFIL